MGKTIRQSFVSCKLALKFKETFSPESFPFCASFLIILFLFSEAFLSQGLDVSAWYFNLIVVLNSEPEICL